MVTSIQTHRSHNISMLQGSMMAYEKETNDNAAQANDNRETDEYLGHRRLLVGTYIIDRRYGQKGHVDC